MAQDLSTARFVDGHPEPGELAAFARGDKLTLDQTQAIETHLNECAACRHTVRDVGPDPFMQALLQSGRDRHDASDRRLVEGYQLIERLGEGGAGIVYRARQPALDRDVALKLLKSGIAASDVEMKRWRRECRALAALDHPHIVKIYDAGEQAGTPFLAMELVEGKTLAHRLLAGPLAAKDAASLVGQLAAAIEFAHQHGVIHRDIKPANILLTPQGQAKITDFGLAKIDLAAQPSDLSLAGFSMGTPDFVAPEVLVQGTTIDGRADIYSVGVMLYQMLVGEVPRGLFQMPGQMTGGEIDPRFDAIITKAMQSNRNARYQTAADLRQGLELIRSKPRSTTGTAPRPKHKAGLARILGILIVLAIAAISALNKGARHDGAAQKEAVSAIKSESASPWTDGLAEWLAAPGHEERGLLTPESGGLRMAASGCTLMLGSSLTARSLGDVAVRVKFRHAGANTLDIHLREQAQPGNFYAATFSESGTTSLIRRMNASSTELASFEPPNGFDPTMPHILEFRSEGQQLSCLLDEKLLGTVTDSTFSSGQFSVVSKGALIEKVEYRALGKAAASSIPTDTGKPR